MVRMPLRGQFGFLPLSDSPQEVCAVPHSSQRCMQIDHWELGLSPLDLPLFYSLMD
jgi:hypothetical protein